MAQRKPYRRYLALPAVVSSRLFQLSLVFSGRPFPNTDLLSSSNNSWAYLSRLACSASSVAFLDVRAVDFGRAVLHPIGMLIFLASGYGLSPREVDSSDRLDVSLSAFVLVESFCCSKGKGGHFDGTVIRTGFFALFGSWLRKSYLILQNLEMKQSLTISI